MIIKDKLQLVSNVPNVLSVSPSVIESFYNSEENSPRHIFVILELKKNSIKHFTKDKILSFVSNIKQREQLRVISFDYPLPVTYNKTAKQLIVNLKVLGAKNVSTLSPNNLYASIVYAYAFALMVTKKFKIQSYYSKSITNYLVSFFTQVFGRDYGLVGLYSTRIPKLRFLVACYILSAFFGIPKDRLFIEASKIAPYLYNNEYDQLRKYDFSNIKDFIISLSEMKVMPGINTTKFTSKLYRYFGINILPALEDCSRFFSIILVSSIAGSSIISRLLVKYNEKEYFLLLDATRRMFS